MSKSLISIHFDGPIAKDHFVKLRTIGNTLNNIQCAIDRAFLDIKYGSVWKFARLKDEDYPPTEFLMDQTRNGGFIADLQGATDDSPEIITRIESALNPAYEQARTTVPVPVEKLPEQAKKRQQNYKNGAQVPVEYDQYLSSHTAEIARSYGDRSILKEFDQIASNIRSQNNDGSYVEIKLFTDEISSTYIFNDKISKNFHQIISERSLGNPIIIPVTLRSLDAGNGGNSKAVMNNLASRKSFTIFIQTSREFSSLKKYLRKRNPPEFSVVACPILEYKSFDPAAGDMYFVSLIS